MPEDRRVLLVDDDQLVCTALKRVLEAKGYPTVAVGSADEALEELANQRFGAALVDLYLRGRRNGVSLVRAMRREGDRTPVIGISGASASDPTVRLMRRDCVAFLSKPFEAAELVQAIKQAAADAHPPPADAPEPQEPERPDHSALLRRVVDDLRTGGARLPMIAPIAADIQVLMAELDCGIKQVLDIVGTDPAMTARIMHAANSTLHRGVRPISTLRSACLRLGNRRVLALAQETLVQELFDLRREPWTGVARAMWRNVVVTARGARELALLVGHDDPESLHIAGLLHNIGELALLGPCSHLAGPAGLDLLHPLTRCVASCHEKLGRQLLSRWGMPSWTVALAGGHHRPGAVEEAEAGRIRRTVLLAWTMALHAGFAYLPGQDVPDPAPLIEALGLEEAQVEAVFEGASSWVS